MHILVYFERYNDCLEYMVRAFSMYNKTSTLHLITNNPDAIIDKVYGIPRVEVVAVSKYNDNEQKLLYAYRHQSVNPFWFEYPSMSRWCIFNEYVTKNNLTEVFTSDWDVLYYRDIDELSQKYRTYDFTVTNRMCGGSSFWFNVKALSQLSDAILDYYTNKDSLLNGQIGGNICDMSFIETLHYGDKYKIFDTKNVIDDECMDDNILNTFDWESVQPEGAQQGMKKMVVIDDIPYCFNKVLNKNIRLNSNHFAGFTRNYMKPLVIELGI